MNDQSINQEVLTEYVSGFEDIKQCWKNILFTVPGTFPMLPTFGCDMFKYVDRPITESFGKLRNIIVAALEKWEPRARIDKVTRTINDSQILINIFGTQINTGLPINTSIILGTDSPTQLLSYNTIAPITIVIGGQAGHDRLHNLSSLLDHEAVTGEDKTKLLTTDDLTGAITFTNKIDGGEL